MCPNGVAEGNCGTCGTSLGHGSSCQYNCNAGFIISGTSSCSYSGQSPVTQFAACSSCAVGQYKADTNAATSCTACPAGYAQAVQQGTQCNHCVAGQYNSGTGKGACTACLAGTASTTVGATSSSVCKSCAAGLYSEETGAGACKSCGTGTYGTETGATTVAGCQKCLAGQYEDNKAGTKCKRCQVGYFMNASTVGASSNSLCQPCSAGKYGTEKGAVSTNGCRLCPSGRYNENSGASTFQLACIQCNPGSFSVHPGAISETFCTSCVAGTYNTEHGSNASSHCLRCPLGTSSSSKRSSYDSCIPCRAGFYASNAGSKTCASCMSGKFSESTTGTSSDVCHNCPHGWYQSELGQRGCVPCAIGSFSNKTAASSSESCQLCRMGKFAAVASGASICIDCLAGYYSSSLGASSLDTCHVCPTNTVSNLTGASTVKACQACSGKGDVPNKKQTKCEAKSFFAKSNAIPIVCVSVAFGVGFVGLAAYCLRRIKRNKAEHFFELTEQNEHTQRLLDSANNPLEQTQFIVDASELHLHGKIGAGGMGWIFKATLGANTVVAAKEIITVAINPEDILEFEHEARMLTQMNHPHVLRVFGFCTKPPEQCEDGQEHRYIVTEFAPNGSLESAIRGAEKIAQIIKENEGGGGVIEMPFSKIQALEWALQVASGMVYLHSRGFMRKCVCGVLFDNGLVLILFFWGFFFIRS